MPNVNDIRDAYDSGYESSHFDSIEMMFFQAAESWKSALAMHRHIPMDRQKQELIEELQQLEKEMLNGIRSNRES